MPLIVFIFQNKAAFIKKNNGVIDFFKRNKKEERLSRLILLIVSL